MKIQPKFYHSVRELKLESKYNILLDKCREVIQVHSNKEPHKLFDQLDYLEKLVKELENEN